MTWHRIVTGVGYVTVVFLLLVLLSVIEISLTEWINGTADDAKCVQLAEISNGEAKDLGQWGDCQVVLSDGSYVFGDRIHLPEEE